MYVCLYMCVLSVCQFVCLSVYCGVSLCLQSVRSCLQGIEERNGRNCLGGGPHILRYVGMCHSSGLVFQKKRKEKKKSLDMGLILVKKSLDEGFISQKFLKKKYIKSALSIF